MSVEDFIRAHAIELLENAPDAVVVVDAGGRIVFANEQTKRIFDMDQSELVGQTIEILIPERLRGAHLRHRLAYVATPQVRPMGSGIELFGRKKDGSEIPVEISLSPLSTSGGSLVSAIIRDISDRKQAEAERRRLQEHLLGAIESIQGAFAIFESDGRLMLCNSTYRSLFSGNLAGEIRGRKFQELLDAQIEGELFDFGSESREEFTARCLAYHNQPSGVLDVRTKSGGSVRIFVRRTTEGGMVKTIWDISEDVQREDELRRARADAEAASAAKSDFLASMSHELRTPLNAILGFAQLLHRDKKQPLSDRQKERIEHVLKGGEHLLHLIDDVLDLARIEAGRIPVSLEPVSVESVMLEAKEALDPMAESAGVELVLPRMPEALEVIADRTRFQQILMNYGSNAIKYGKRGGKARFTAELQGELVRVTVSDDGLGIPPEQQEHVFSPFHRAGQETGPIQGTGIGLAITKRLAEIMGGQVGFHSVHGSGSTFWVALPVHRVAAQSERDPRPSPQSARTVLGGSEGPSYSIVYIEDNPSNIAFMKELVLDFERVELITAPTAEIGIELVRAKQPQVVIMDINLPGMSGLEATKKLREWPQTSHIPVIGLSAAAMIRDAARVNEAGFYRYLTKPVKVDELTNVLEELLAPK